jgi:transposase-like protein
VELPDHVRAAVLADVGLTHQQAITAEENDKVRVYLAVEQGVTTYEICQELGVSQSVVSNWRRQGEEIFRRRESARSNQAGVDPVRP